MPGGDRTGPFGSGPRSGRGLGFCGGSGGPGSAGGGSRAGANRGAGRGWRHWFRATGLPGWLRFGAGSDQSAPNAPADVNKEYLTRRLKALEQERDVVKEQLDQLNDPKGPVASAQG
jgi:hypothetical protein